MARRKVPPLEATTDEVMNKTYLFEHAAKLDGFMSAMAVMNTVVPARTTCRQLQVFAAIVAANAKGMRVTLSDLKEQSPETADGPRVNEHLNRSYQMFLPPTPKDPEALGWITQVPDAQDGRKKYLILSQAGRDVAVAMAEAFKDGE
jgi:hypothetical protein